MAAACSSPEQRGAPERTCRVRRTAAQTRPQSRIQAPRRLGRRAGPRAPAAAPPYCSLLPPLLARLMLAPRAHAEAIRSQSRLGLDARGAWAQGWRCSAALCPPPILCKRLACIDVNTLTTWDTERSAQNGAKRSKIRSVTRFQSVKPWPQAQHVRRDRRCCCTCRGRASTAVSLHVLLQQLVHDLHAEVVDVVLRTSGCKSGSWVGKTAGPCPSKRPPSEDTLLRWIGPLPLATLGPGLRTCVKSSGAARPA